MFAPAVRQGLAALLAATIGAALGAPSPARADDSVTIQYFTISPSDPDADHLSFGTVDNEVQNQLGPDGLPVLNTAAFGCTSNCFSLPSGPTNLVASGAGAGEITYWDPKLNPFVTLTSTATTTLPFDHPSNFFPPNGTGTCDGPCGYQAAEITGNIVVPTGQSDTISFTIGADDMAFAFLDGKVVCDLGGVHGSTAGTCVSPFAIGAGDHSLEVFFVDINQVQSGLTFTVNNTDVTVTPPGGGDGTGVPEPASLSLFALGFGGLAFIWRRRMN
ncbi:MAG: PEP-CTERM sorting domain-containing protein [Proteobacteria bacterium]|nr:PEP-CTERM sorting domain-containing protein [Pseudomonadota bacterium]